MFNQNQLQELEAKFRQLNSSSLYTIRATRSVLAGQTFQSNGTNIKALTDIEKGNTVLVFLDSNTEIWHGVQEGRKESNLVTERKFLSRHTQPIKKPIARAGLAFATLYYTDTGTGKAFWVKDENKAPVLVAELTREVELGYTATTASSSPGVAYSPVVGYFCVDTGLGVVSADVNKELMMAWDYIVTSSNSASYGQAVRPANLVQQAFYSDPLRGSGSVRSSFNNTTFAEWFFGSLVENEQGDTTSITVNYLSASNYASIASFKKTKSAVVIGLYEGMAHGTTRLTAFDEPTTDEDGNLLFEAYVRYLNSVPVFNKLHYGYLNDIVTYDRSSPPSRLSEDILTWIGGRSSSIDGQDLPDSTNSLNYSQFSYIGKIFRNYIAEDTYYSVDSIGGMPIDIESALLLREGAKPAVVTKRRAIPDEGEDGENEILTTFKGRISKIPSEAEGVIGIVAIEK